MARPLRPDPVDGWHHVMNRGVDKMRIFADDRDRFEFGGLLEVVCARYSIEVHAYCLMTNHFHLLLRCPDANVSAFMHDLTGEYAKRFNRRHGRVGHLFGDRFTSRLVTTHEYIATAVRYIHRNPLDIAGVERCVDYRWSSHRTYLGLRPAPRWLHIEPVIGWFGGAAGISRFVEDHPSSATTETVAACEAYEAIDLVLAQHSSLSGRQLLGQRTAIAIAVDDRVGLDGLLRSSDRATASSVRSARHRARANFRRNPENHHFTGLVADLLGLSSEASSSAA